MLRSMNMAPDNSAAPPPGLAHRLPLRVFLAEGSEILRSRIVDLFGEVEGVRVTGVSGSAEGATAEILRSLPDAVVLDLQLSGGSGLDVLNAVHPHEPQIDFIILTNHSGPQYRRLCMARGARHFLDKSHDFARLGPILAGLASGLGNKVDNRGIQS